MRAVIRLFLALAALSASPSSAEHIPSLEFPLAYDLSITKCGIMQDVKGRWGFYCLPTYFYVRGS